MIAVDAMGGDFAPHSVVQGALQAARKNIKVGLYGDQVQLFSLLYELDLNWEQLPIEVIHCSQVIEMTDQASRSILQKKDSSLVRALVDVQQEKAHAVVSAGNSGAALVGGTLILGRVPGIERPAIGNFLPNMQDGSTFCIDLGANVDCKPEQLVQFAIMGHVYTKMVHHIANPRIGLLSNGHEPYKGSQLIKKTYCLLEQSPDLNFIGNVEPTDLFSGRADVLVSDGFSGNIMLKTAEGTSAALKYWLRQEYSASWWGKFLGFFGRTLFARIRSRLDYERQGGALLLGIRSPLVVAHGCSNAQAITNAIKFAHKKVKTAFISRFVPQVIDQINKHEQIVPAVTSKKLHSMLKFDKSV